MRRETHTCPNCGIKLRLRWADPELQKVSDAGEIIFVGIEEAIERYEGRSVKRGGALTREDLIAEALECIVCHSAILSCEPRYQTTADRAGRDSLEGEARWLDPAE